jgi:phospholipid/cholesterol/gamma-HCH transport system permease protein
LLKVIAPHETPMPFDPTPAESAPLRFAIEAIRHGRGSVEVKLSGELSFAQATELWDQLRGIVGRARRRSELDFDMAGVTQLDSGAAALLVHTRAELQRRGVRSEFKSASDHIQEIIHLLHGDAAVKRRHGRRARGVLDQIGEAVVHTLAEARTLFAFIGELSLANLRLAKRPSSANWRDLFPIMERAGADAVPIVTLISFLVGLVSAAQSAAQLERYGANVFVADLVALSMTRELGPLMTAIVVTGRSGAAFAAELGSMKVNEEIDALRTMGFAPMRFLVFPRMLALILMMPLLVLFANVLGILGGLVVGVTRLDLSAASYMHRVAEAVKPWDLGSGLFKSGLFALAIAAISCQQGLATRGGAAAVGHRTTSAVVGILFSLILIDAVFAVAVGVMGR